MNVLIVGKQGGFCQQLADRLNRERNEIYYISGNRTDDKLSNSVFQHYFFPYLNENINQIVYGTSPDTVIVAGACDENFTWQFPEKDATEYVTSMTSLFMAAQNAGVRRLIYISSTDVYENNRESSVTSDIEPDAYSVKAKAMLRVEKLLSQFQNSDSGEKAIEVIILRLPQVVGDYMDNSTDFCLRTILDYINDGKMTIFPDIKHTALHYRDAAEAVMCCTRLPQDEKLKVFQVKGLVFTEEEFSKALIETGWHKGAIVERQTNKGRELGCPSARIDASEETRLGFKTRYDLKAMCDLTCKACLKKRKENQKSERRKIQLLPIIESVVFAIVTYLITLWLLGTWVGNALNLFAIYVLLLAVVYGISHGLLASILAATGLLFIWMRDDSFVSVVSNYSFYLQALQLIVIGVIAGFVRDKYSRKNKQLTEDKNYLTNELGEVTRINDNNVYVKNIYEKRLIGYENSLSHIYELTTRLDFMESQKVTFQAVHMVADLMEMNDVAIYTASRKSKFLRLAAATSELASSCGKSLKFDEESFLYESLANNSIYANREAIEKRPTFGGAVYADGMLLAIILVWTDDLRQVNLYESDMLAIACRLIEKSMARAYLYEESLRSDTYLGGTNIMKPDAFIKMLNVFEDGYQQNLLSYTTLKVLLNGQSPEEAAKLVRDTDYVGLINGVPCIILSNSTMTDAQFVLRRYKERGMEAIPVDSKTILEDAKDILKMIEKEQEANRITETIAPAQA